MRDLEGISGSLHDFFVFNSSGAVWNGASYVAWSDGSYATYRVAATERGTSGKFYCTLPSNAAWWDLRLRAGTLAGSTILDDDVATESSGGGGSTVGPGASSNVITITLDGSTPLADADVWISTDEDGANVIAGTLQSNSDGQVTFLLDSGVTYYLWAQKDGANPIEGESFVAD